MMDWRELWALASGYPPPVHHLHPILGSVIFYASTFLICASLQRLNRTLSPRPLQGFIADFVSTFHVCACALENGNSVRLFGWAGLFCVVFSLGVLYRNIFTDSCANPVDNFRKFFVGRQSFVKTAVKVALQALAGYSAFQYAKQFWSLDIHQYHHIRYNQKQCYSILSVSVAMGFFLEGGATMIDILLDYQALVPWKQLDNIMKCSLMAAIVVAGVSLTGMYFHPAMASSQNFGCKGTQSWEHVVVYWVGPLVGCFLAVTLHGLIRQAIGTKPISNTAFEKKPHILRTTPSANGFVGRPKQGNNPNMSEGNKKKSKKFSNKYSKKKLK